MRRTVALAAVTLAGVLQVAAFGWALRTHATAVIAVVGLATSSGLAATVLLAAMCLGPRR